MCTGLIFVFAMKYNGHFIKQPFMSMFLVICDLIDSVSCHGKYRRMTRTLDNCCAIVQIVNELCKSGIQDSGIRFVRIHRKMSVQEAFVKVGHVCLRIRG